MWRRLTNELFRLFCREWATKTIRENSIIIRDRRLWDSSPLIGWKSRGRGHPQYISTYCLLISQDVKMIRSDWLSIKRQIGPNFFALAV